MQTITNGSEVASYAYDHKGNIYGGNGILRNYNYQNLPLEMSNVNSETYNYTYNSGGERIRKANAADGSGEYYLRDYLGRELVIYDNSTDEPKSANIFGNGLVGKIEINGTTEIRSYYLKDHLGDIRCVLSAEGIVQSAQDYYPYGETIREYNGVSIKYKFTEKERDTESSYDYFGARYYDSNLGMWLQVDPLSEKYPGWSSYNYTLCNPIIYFDPNGKWSEKIHNKLIDKAFSNVLSEREIRILQNASKFVDQDQSLIGSFKHSMRAAWQTKEEAQEMLEKYIEIKKQDFMNLSGDEAIFALGEALHSVMDATSPAHEGFQAWNGLGGLDGSLNLIFGIEAIVHFGRELKITPQTEKTTIENMRQFLKAWLEEKEDNEEKDSQSK